MKKAILISTLVLSISIVNAQFAIGPTGGVGHSWFHHDEQEGVENEFHLAYQAGVKMLYSFSGPVGISADVRFSAEGGKYNYVSSGNNIITKYRLHYIRVPLQLVYYFGESTNNVRPKISAGPSFGFLIGGKQDVSVNGANSFSEDAEKLFEKSDVGLTAGAGLAFKMGNSFVLTTDVNFYTGFTEIYKELPSPELKNRTLQFNLGFLFPLGGSKNTTVTTDN